MIEIAELRAMMERGIMWLTVGEAAKVLGCTPQALRNAAEKKGTLGSILYMWAGNELRISINSVLRFLAGGYTIRDIFGTGIEYAIPFREEVEKR